MSTITAELTALIEWIVFIDQLEDAGYREIFCPGGDTDIAEFLG